MGAAEKKATEGAVRPPNPWDPLVRISHWAIAAAVIANGLITKSGSATHVWVGWAVIGVLASRLIWGFVGPAEARFNAFPPSPAAALRHIGHLWRGGAREYPSHNPAGAIMIYALWACLTLVIVTGLFMTGGKSPVTLAEERAAIAAGDWSVLAKPVSESNDGTSRFYIRVAGEVHELAANLLLILAFVHVGGVFVESRALGRNLIRPMIAGKRRRS
ncbi:MULTISPECIES: cytochrome b/b6 domain-containing protein [Ensifer]|uniref:cytochrome b/b6 domain-containing protein n=1 Tax=Ensifer TaxID=106591 RepID=UPI000DC4B521|nr:MULTISPECIES: cytochrome b/b6 domain-containing protein [Ensifer]MCY1745185.1 cytochrome b/b6 domain-containing protein [Ensifer sp. SL37]RAR98485.1 cytochrome b [Ensifer adhaerens]